MKVCGRHVLDAFCREHSHARGWIEQWLSDVEGTYPTSAQELQAKYASVAATSGTRALFDVMSSKYCVEVTVAFRTGTLYVRWAGLRSEYELRPDHLRIAVEM
jgi:mRNA-degrading endonuclease HigB of HigAB toxin-antitoxin module